MIGNKPNTKLSDGCPLLIKQGAAIACNPDSVIIP